ncbi:MAG: hypothetical protein KA059_01725 [Elusimicrobiales bacterium]|jgi:hypothetical protein|nr:hypothetical protein [Elusimicrobiales bacterium]NLH38859.1 hypothetical protein [Elusimicrobiota bacterium]
MKRKAQLLLPSVLVIPSLLIFIYLLYETTKLSREKIRTQFALDSAAFIQMQDYTNFLNRTAYVDGAFPYRIFKQEWDCKTQTDYLQRTDDNGNACPYSMFYEIGAFPGWSGDVIGQDPSGSVFDNSDKWEIKYNDQPTELVENPRQSNLNTANPDFGEQLTFINPKQAQKIYIFWDPSVNYYKFYAQVYLTLGTIEESQFAVFQRLTDKMNFYRKSFYLNAANQSCLDNPDSCGSESLGGSGIRKWNRNSDVKFHYIKSIKWWAKYYVGGLPPYEIAKTDPPIEFPNPGIFQLTTVDPSLLKQIGMGYQLYQPVDAGKNYFNVDFNSKGWKECSDQSKPCVHSAITSQCPSLTSGNNCLWPNPTPKYQTRLYP